jgi:quercetin dioxygenase-like cupin family protein
MKRTIENPILKDVVTFTTLSTESGGAFTELEATVMPGASSPPHFHETYDETITALEGAIILDLGKGAEVNLSSGESYVIHRGQTHGLRNVSDSIVRVRSHIAPGSRGFEDGLRILYGLAADGKYNKHKMPKNPMFFAICLSISDTRLPGAASLLNPIVDMVARLGSWFGVETQLRERYCA